jgi:hypothetical protein
MSKFLILTAVLVLAPAPLIASDRWQPDEAARIVSGLLDTLNYISEQSASAEMQPDGVKSKAVHAALVDIRSMIEELERLELALSVGRGKIQTMASYRRISNLRDSVEDYARGAEISEDLRNEANDARRLLRRLDLMYF